MRREHVPPKIRKKKERKPLGKQRFNLLVILVGCLFCSQLSSSSPQCSQAMQGQGMHLELEMYANRLAEAEQRQRAMSTPDLLVSFPLVSRFGCYEYQYLSTLFHAALGF